MYLYLTRVLKVLAPVQLRCWRSIQSGRESTCFYYNVCVQLEEPVLLLYIQTSHSFAHSLPTTWTLFTAMDSALVLIHQQFIFLEKKMFVWRNMEINIYLNSKGLFSLFSDQPLNDSWYCCLSICQIKGNSGKVREVVLFSNQTPTLFCTAQTITIPVHIPEDFFNFSTTKIFCFLFVVVW